MTKTLAKAMAACELHRDWRKDIEGLRHLPFIIPAYRNLMTSHLAKK